MPTYTVGTGKTYSTITAALAAVPSNLSGTGVHTIEVDEGTYNEAVDISKSGSSASNYIHLKAASGSEHRFDLTAGVIIGGSQSGTSDSLRVRTSFTRVSDVIAMGTNNVSAAVVNVDRDSCFLKNVIAIIPSNASFNYQGITLGSGGGSDSFLACCAAINFKSGNSLAAFTCFTTGGVAFLNCLAYNFGNAFTTNAFGFATNYVQNSIMISTNTTTHLASGMWDATKLKNNASTNGIGQGTGNLVNLALSQIAFVSIGVNFHILSSSRLFNAGVSQASVFTEDIDRQTISDWSIGPDAQTRPSSLVVADQPYAVRQWPVPIVEPAIQWVQDSAGNWNGSDRGAAQDVYETEVVFFDTQENINSLMEILEENREGVTLSGFAAPLFSPEVDHTGSISATVVSYGPRRHLAFGSASQWVYELPVTFRAISPTLLGTSASLATLKLQEGFEATASLEVGKAFTYNQTAVYSDRRSDTGRFVGRFRQTTAQVQAILSYLLTTARANSIAFPSAIPVTYPWGVNRGAATNCRVKSWSLRRVNFVFWDLDLELVEAV